MRDAFRSIDRVFAVAAPDNSALNACAARNAEDALRSRIADLEREVADLRRRLEPTPPHTWDPGCER